MHPLVGSQPASASLAARMDSLSGKVYEGPWYTPGYFLHCMPIRRLAEGRAA